MMMPSGRGEHPRLPVPWTAHAGQNTRPRAHGRHREQVRAHIHEQPAARIAIGEAGEQALSRNRNVRPSATAPKASCISASLPR